MGPYLDVCRNLPLWVNSEMENLPLFHTCPTCQYSPGCEWSLTWMYVGASLWVNSEMGWGPPSSTPASTPGLGVLEHHLDVCRSLPLGELPVLGVGGALPGCM